MGDGADDAERLAWEELERMPVEEQRAILQPLYGPLTAPQLQARVEAQVAAADSPTALLRLCLPAVGHDASCGVIGARPLLLKIHEVLAREDQ